MRCALFVLGAVGSHISYEKSTIKITFTTQSHPATTPTEIKFGRRVLEKGRCCLHQERASSGADYPTGTDFLYTSNRKRRTIG